MMHAEIFTVEKIPYNYGNRTYQLRGKGFPELQIKLPGYIQKVMETQLEVASSIPTDKDKAVAEYIEFRRMLFARDKLEGFTQSTEDGFKDRMKLLQYYKIIGEIVDDTYTSLVLYDNPIDWLDKSSLLFESVNLVIYQNYIQPGHLRPNKIISKTDHCAELAHSLENDHGWDHGSADNAYDLVFRCYDIFPYNDVATKKIFDLFLLMTEFYVFQNYSSNGVGAGVAFKALKEQQLHFDSSPHFHDYIGRMINKFNDAHLSYKVDCYEQFTFVQPVYIQQVFDEDHKFKVYIAKVNSVELQEWVGAKVMAIDGTGTELAMYVFGGQLGKCRYGYTRFNLGLSRLFFESSSQDFQLDRGLFLKRTTMPERNYVVYTLRKPGLMRDVEIKVKWRVLTCLSLLKWSEYSNTLYIG